MKAEWIVIDATGKSFGRLSSLVAHTVQGKHRPDYLRHQPYPVSVVVVNCAEIHINERLATSLRYHHTGYIGNLKTKVFTDKPIADRLVESVAHMLPKNASGRKMIQQVHCYMDANHPYHGQTDTIKENTDHV